MLIIYSISTMFRGKNTENGGTMSSLNWLLIVAVLTVHVSHIRCDGTMGNATMEPTKVQSCNVYNATDLLKIKSSCSSETTYLFVKDSHFHVFPHIFELFPNLLSVDVSNAGIGHIESSTFDAATHLTILDMDGSNMSTLFNNIFEHVNNLTALDLVNSSVVNIEQHAFHGLSNLKRLDLSNNQIVKLDAQIFQPLSRLESIRLSNNKIEVINADLFKHNVQLKWAYFSQNSIIIVDPNSFINCKLATLDLGFNQLHDVDMTTLKYLKSLNVANNRLDTLKVPTEVTEIHAENNSIAMIYSEEKLELSNLFLSSNSFTNLRSFTNNFAKLHFLDLSNNHYRSINFSDLKNLTQLKELKLTGNKLSPVQVNDVIANLPKLALIELSTKHWSDAYTEQLKTDLKNHSIDLGQDRSIIVDNDPIVTTIRPSTVTDRSTDHPAIPTQSPNVERRLDEIVRQLKDVEANAAANKKQLDDVDQKIEKSHTANNAEYASMMSTFKVYETLIIIVFASGLIFVAYKAIVYAKSVASGMRYSRTQSHDPIFSEQDL